MSRSTMDGADAIGPHLTVELGGTAFNSLGSLRALISASSKDNVQPQAVLAAEQLGFGILAAPQRINEAIDCLGGNDSVKLESVRASIGLSSGGTKQIVRASTSLLQTFLLCAACKLCYLDEEIGSLMFEMLVSQHILSKYPASAFQLHQFVKQLSGHCESITPADLMHEIATRVDVFSPDPDIFHRMNMKVLANLLNQLFENYRDESVVEITLQGHDHGIWLSTVILWLLEADSCLFIDGNLIKSTKESKVKVLLLSKSAEPWNLVAWRRGGSPTDYTYPYDQDETESLRRLPLRSFKSYLDQYYWSAFDDRKTRIDASTLTGRIAQALILFAADNANLFMLRSCDSAFERCCQCQLSDIAQTEWLKDCGSLILRYGWLSIDEGVQMLYDLLKLQKNVDGYANLEQTIKKACVNEVQRELGEAIESDYIIDPAIYIATDAIITSTCKIINGRRYIRPPDTENLNKSEFLYFSMLHNGLNVVQFRRSALFSAMPGLQEQDDGDLIVSSNGYIAGYSNLWNLSTLQKDALSISILKGDIRQEDAVYDRIRELNFQSIQTGRPIGQAIVQQEGTNESRRFRLEIPALQPGIQFSTVVSASGTTLNIKHYMIRPNTSTQTILKRKASWIDSTNALATAFHLGQSPATLPRQEQLLISRIAEMGTVSPILCGSPFDCPSIDEFTKLLILTRNDEKIRFFAAGISSDIPGHCSALVIRHEASLVRCIVDANEIQNQWRIIC